MEIKKNKTADLEGIRAQGFLLGLVFVLAALFVGFEYTQQGAGDDADQDLLDDMADMELLPIEEQTDMKVLKEELPKPAEKITVVELEPEPAAPELQPDQQAADAVAQTEADEETDLTQPDNADDADVLDFRVVQELPQFPGGAVELMKWLTKNLKYPAAARDRRQQGKVVAQFTIDKDGSVTDIEIVQPLGGYCDREALRVLRMMPKWKPGTQDAKPCRTRVCIPIVFKL